ncbi:hypothetical protein OROHE_008468 [Orobanche hederae]
MTSKPNQYSPTQPILLLFSTLLSFSLLPSHSADPDALQDFCIADLKRTPSTNGFPCKLDSEVTSNDFFFDGLTGKGNTSNPFGSSVTPGNVLAFPGLNTLGLSMNRVDLAVGGINPPHMHPRAAESGVIIHGKVLVGLITTGNKYYSKVLTKGKMFVVPKGMVHFQMNVGINKALIVTAFNSQLPGVVVVSTNLFGSKPSIGNDVLTKAFQVEKSVVDEIKSKFSG